MSAILLTPAQQEVVDELDARINANTAAIENDRQARDRIMSLGRSGANGAPSSAPQVMARASARSAGGKTIAAKSSEESAKLRAMKGRDLVHYALQHLDGEATVGEMTDYLRGLGLRRNEPRVKLNAQLYQAARAGDGKMFLQNQATGQWRVINKKP